MDLKTVISDFLVREHPAHAAVALVSQPVDEGSRLLADLPSDNAAVLLKHVTPMTALDYLRTIQKPARLIDSLPSDDAARILRLADRETAMRLLEDVNGPHARSIRAKLSFAEDTVGGVAEPSTMLPGDTTVEDAKAQARQKGRPYIYVIDHNTRLIGVVKLAALWQHPPDTPLADIMDRDVICLNHQTPVHAALRHPAWTTYDMLPVVDARNELVGAVRHKRLRQRIDAKADWMPVHAAVATMLDLAELYWTTGATLLLGSSVGTTRSKHRTGGQ